MMKRKRASSTSSGTSLALAVTALALSQPPPRPRDDSPRASAEALAKMADDAKAALVSPPSAKRCPCGHPAWTHAGAAQIAMRLRETRGQWSKECTGAAYNAAHCRCTHSREDVEASAR